MSDTQGYIGQFGIAKTNSEFNAHESATKRNLGDTRTNVPVKIVALHGGGVDKPPTVDVQPLIAAIDSQGNATPHGVIYGIPVARVQSGGVQGGAVTNAIIMDPQVGDCGHMVISDRDISSLKSNSGTASNPGSFRRHDVSDGVYHMAMLMPTPPNQYVQFLNGGGIKIADKYGNSIVLGASGITITDCNGNVINMTAAAVAVTSPQLTNTTDVIAQSPGSSFVSLVLHQNTNVTPGPALTGPPQPGT